MIAAVIGGNKRTEVGRHSPRSCERLAETRPSFKGFCDNSASIFVSDGFNDEAKVIRGPGRLADVETD